jgi:pilus assembly protein FimV
VPIKPKLKACVLALILALPLSAGAVGLGRLNVLSGLGQPFRAEIDLVSVQPGESEGLLARLAPPEAFAQAQVAYPSAALGLRLVIEKRANGQHFVLVSSTQSISEPFLDLLIDLNWSGGKIQRDYTALIDPVGYTPSPVAAANDEAKSRESFAPSALPGTRRRGAVLAPKKSETAASQSTVEAKQAASQPAAKTKQATSQYKVKGGDTLSGVARQTGAEGITLEQMLVGLYRQNPDAFDGNMNRLRRGKILNVPSKDELQSLPVKEARQEVRIQSKDWQAYRNKVAEAVQKRPAVAGNEVANAGRISPKVEEKAKSSNAQQDVLKLSKGEAPGKVNQQGEQARVRALEEEVAAKQKGLDESNQRVAALQKNVHDMEKLLALKSQKGVELQKSSKVTDVPVPIATSSPTASPVALPTPAIASKVTEVASAPQALHASAAVANKPKVHHALAPAPVAEPSMVDTLADNVLPIGGGLAAVLLGGAGFWWSRRRKQGSAFADSVLTGGDLKSNTLLGNTGGAVISTQPTENSFLTDFSRQGLGTIDTDEVDPIAEAEVYMAYDRNEQAEEILRDALLKDPSRHEIRMKLLEIFAAKKDPTSYEEIAADLFAMTSGRGAHWERAAYQGSILDPENPLYQRVELAPTAVPVEMVDGLDESVEDFDLPLEDLPAAVSDFDSLMSEDIAEPASELKSDSLTDLDLSLDFDMDEIAPLAKDDGAEINPFLDMAQASDDLPVAKVDEFADLKAFDQEPVPELPAMDDFAAGIDFGLDDFLVPEEVAKPIEMHDEAVAAQEPLAAAEDMLSLDLPVDFSVGSEPEVSAPPLIDPVFDLNFDGLDGLNVAPEAAPLPDFAAALPDLDLGDLSDEDPFGLPVMPEVAEATPSEFATIAEPAVLAPPEVAAMSEDVLEATSADDGLGLDFDFSLNAPLEISAPNLPLEESIDLAAMNLDFDGDAGIAQSNPLEFSGDDPVQTKIDLAKAYVDMGDTEGAREILQEAIGEGNPEQQKQAKALLGNL